MDKARLSEAAIGYSRRSADRLSDLVDLQACYYLDTLGFQCSWHNLLVDHPHIGSMRSLDSTSLKPALLIQLAS